MTADNYDYMEGNIKIDKLNDLKSGNHSNQSIQRAIAMLLTNELQSFNQEHKQLDNISLQDIDILSINNNGTIFYRRRFLRKIAEYKYTSREQSILFAATAIGALFAILPISFSIQYYGIRKTFAIVLIISGLSTALCPLAASFGVSFLIISRILQGIGFASCMPLIGSVTSTWAKLTENGLFSGALTSFIQLGPVITMPMSGFLCSTSLGWPSVFYVHATITLIFLVIWWILYRDQPGDAHWISASELKLITDGKSDNKVKRSEDKLPIREIFQTSSVWAIWIAAIGNMYSIQMVVVFAPTYISQVLGLPIVSVGLTAALPTLLQFAIKMLAGTASDKITSLRETTKVRLFNTIAFVGMGIFLIALAYTPANRTIVALIFLISSTTILGFNTGGFFKSCTLVGRQYSYFVNAVVQVVMCIAMLTVPFIVTTLTPNGLSEEWYHVFILHAAFLFITNVIFCKLGKGTAAAFTSSNGISTENTTGEQLKPVFL
uniref:Major facilitator superfamily (MFS) profile domain-containing protein n=2 Tax=Wuchereria bancrofti TaxID=6293 RepID=A0AAF5Q0H7_WUCBA